MNPLLFNRSPPLKSETAWRDPSGSWSNSLARTRYTASTSPGSCLDERKDPKIHTAATGTTDRRCSVTCRNCSQIWLRRVMPKAVVAEYARSTSSRVQGCRPGGRNPFDSAFELGLNSLLPPMAINLVTSHPIDNCTHWRTERPRSVRDCSVYRQRLGPAR